MIPLPQGFGKGLNVRAIVINRLIQTVVTVLIVSFIAFMLVQLIPGDPVATILGMEATVEEVENLRRELGLDQPLFGSVRQLACQAGPGGFRVFPIYSTKR